MYKQFSEVIIYYINDLKQNEVIDIKDTYLCIDMYVWEIKYMYKLFYLMYTCDVKEWNLSLMWYFDGWHQKRKMKSLYKY